jgi:hypothetical protein
VVWGIRQDNVPANQEVTLEAWALSGPGRPAESAVDEVPDRLGPPLVRRVDGVGQVSGRSTAAPSFREMRLMAKS